MKYVAFLRGINVGGNKKIKMSDLKSAFEDEGFNDVKTLLNSGNILFSASESSVNKIEIVLEKVIKTKFDMEVDVIVRSIDQIQKLAKQEPFRNIKVSKNTRLYVTFLKSPTKPSIKLPYESINKDFRILTSSDTEVCSVVVLNPRKSTTDVMKLLEKEYGKSITTRNWNTVLRILKK